MATARGNGSGTTGAASYTLRLECWEESVNNTDNTSVVVIEAYLDTTNYNFYDWNIPTNLYIDGVNVYSGSPKVGVGTYSSVLLARGSRVVTHNSDGTKSISFSGSISQTSQYYLPGNASCSSNLNLTTIPRASKPSINTYPNNSPDFNIGDEITIYMNRKSNAFTHTVNFKYGNTTKQIATGVTNNCTFDTSTIEDELYALIPNANVLKGTIEVITYNGTTKIGTNTCSYNAYVPSNIIPTIDSVDFSQTQMEMNVGAYVQSKSKITYNVTASGVKGSSIKSYKVEINGEVHTTRQDTTEYLSIVGQNTCKVTVVDTRGMSATYNKTFNVLAYTKPKLTYSAIDRDETTETRVNVCYEGTVSNLNFANAWQLRVLAFEGNITIPDDTTLAELEAMSSYRGTIKSGRDETFYVNTYFVQMSAEESFTVYFFIADTYDIVNSENVTLAQLTYLRTDVGTAEELINFSADGKNVAIGQIYDENQGGRLQIKGNIILNGEDLVKQILLASHPVGSLYWSKYSTPPDELFGGTWVPVEDVFILAAGSNYSAGSTGGEATHTLTNQELPKLEGSFPTTVPGSHNNYATGVFSGDSTTWSGKTLVANEQSGSNMWGYKFNAGNNQAHNNMPPYKVRYCWERTA